MNRVYLTGVIGTEIKIAVIDKQFPILNFHYYNKQKNEWCEIPIILTEKADLRIYQQKKLKHDVFCFISGSIEIIDHKILLSVDNFIELGQSQFSDEKFSKAIFMTKYDIVNEVIVEGECISNQKNSTMLQIKQNKKGLFYPQAKGDILIPVLTPKTLNDKCIFLGELYNDCLIGEIKQLESR